MHSDGARFEESRYDTHTANDTCIETAISVTPPNNDPV